MPSNLEVSDRAFAKRLLLTMAGQGIVLGAVMYFLARIMNDNKEESFRRWVKGKLIRLTRSENNLLASVCEAVDITEDFSSIGGCEHVKEVVQRSVVLPMRHPELYPANSLRSPPKGVLLHGPPGTGKTLVAKAIAKTCDAAFIEVCVENLFGKWLGQSEQTVAAIFSLARKISPTIVFVDEMDSLLSRRDFSDNHAYSNAKTIFLRQWDGFSTCESDHRVVVVGATNCPEVLDPAVLRRLPVKLRLDLPSLEERLEILSILLRGEDFSQVRMREVATTTKRFSGSDLRELCKQALLLMVQDELGRREDSAVAKAPALDNECFARALMVVKANADFVSEMLPSQRRRPLHEEDFVSAAASDAGSDS